MLLAMTRLVLMPVTKARDGPAVASPVTMALLLKVPVASTVKLTLIFVEAPTASGPRLFQARLTVFPTTLVLVGVALAPVKANCVLLLVSVRMTLDSVVPPELTT